VCVCQLTHLHANDGEYKEQHHDEQSHVRQRLHTATNIIQHSTAY